MSNAENNEYVIYAPHTTYKKQKDKSDWARTFSQPTCNKMKDDKKITENAGVAVML